MGTVQLEKINKSYESVSVIHDVDLEIKDGEFMVFVGPSGCGKSTILRMIAGLEDISSGVLRIDQTVVNDIPPAQRGTAMVFQNYALYPHMTVGQNLGFSLKLAGQSKADVAAAVGKAAEILRISHLLERKPKALSGGERQRVAIGRAIVRKPAVFLFDEPLSNLDASLRVQMRLELTALHRELGTTMIYVTHDQVEAMTMGDRVVVFNAGRVEQVGKPLSLYEHPANTFVAGFLGSPRMNFLPCEVTAVQPGQLQLRVATSLSLTVPCLSGSTRRPTLLGVRPEHLQLRPRGEGLPAKIELLEHLGDVTIAHCRPDTSPELISVKIGARQASAFQTGMLIGLLPDADDCVLFDAEGKALD